MGNLLKKIKVLYENADVDNRGYLIIGGCTVDSLVKQYGTPLYVLDEKVIINRCQAFKSAFQKRYDNFLPVFASKSLMALAALKLIKKQGFGIDVASEGELYGAKLVKFSDNDIFYHGNYKKFDEIKTAIQNGIGRVVVDSNLEIKLLKDICKLINKKVNILLRITPAVDVDTNHKITTGTEDTKFGFPLNEDLYKIISSLKYDKNIVFKGIHFHLGSQIMNPKPFSEAITKVINFFNSKRISFDEISIGGGFGIPYLPNDKPAKIEEFAKEIIKALQCQKYSQKLISDEKKAFNKYKTKSSDKKITTNHLPKLFVEPGRCIVAPAGITLYSVGPLKRLPNIRNYLSIDGGLSDNPRPAMYNANYFSVIANKMNKTHCVKWRICGRHCEADTIIDEAELPDKIEPNDILAIFCTGAYNYSMSSNYNKFPRPAVVFVKDGESKIIVKREKIEDLFKNDILD